MDDLREKTKKALERVNVFNDSKEVALGVNEIDDYWAREACVHIEGLWQLTKQMKQLLSRAIKHINDLEAEVGEQARVNGMGGEREVRALASKDELVMALDWCIRQMPEPVLPGYYTDGYKKALAALVKAKDIK